MSGGHPALLIAGPTASGKSALAIEIAERAGGEIVNADSMQVYADLPVLSARPSAADMARVPHHLFGHVDAAVRYSVGRWLAEALEAMAGIRRRGRAPVLAGGTGLYFRALTKGLADVPDPGPDARAKAAAVLEQGGLAALAKEAARLDPEGTARLAANDRQRLLRIVAVGYGTGEALSRLQAQTAPPALPGAWRGAVLDAPAAQLNARIEARLCAMAEQGAVGEAARLAARGLAPDLPAMKALGVAEFAAHARGELSLEDAIQRAAVATRQYAKRQRTWFRNQTPDWPRVDAISPEAASMLAAALQLG